jgi:GNAT superfamily N-acetyltransferase
LAAGRPVGFGSLLWQSNYPPFRESGTPEIHDLNVAPQARRQGVASAILDLAEGVALRRHDRVGIGVGLHPGYRAAQRLYVLRGYVPDGNGVFWNGRFPSEGEPVLLDDALVLYLLKERDESRTSAPRF